MSGNPAAKRSQSVASYFKKRGVSPWGRKLGFPKREREDTVRGKQIPKKEEERINRGLPPPKEKRKRTWLDNYLVAMSFSLLSKVFFQERDQLLTHFEKAFIFYNKVDIWAFRIFLLLLLSPVTSSRNIPSCLNSLSRCVQKTNCVSWVNRHYK